MGINEALAAALRRLSSGTTKKRISSHKVGVKKQTVKASSPEPIGRKDVCLENGLISNFVGVASNSNNSLGAFVFGTQTHHEPHHGTHLWVDTAYIPSQTAGKTLVKIHPGADGRITPPTNTMASKAFTSAEANKENVQLGETAGNSTGEGKGSNKSKDKRELVGWLQVIHVNQIGQDHESFMNDLLVSVRRSVGHLFAQAVGTQNCGVQCKRGLVVLIGFIESGRLSSLYAHEQLADSTFRPISIGLGTIDNGNATTSPQLGADGVGADSKRNTKVDCNPKVMKNMSSKKTSGTVKKASRPTCSGKAPCSNNVWSDSRHWFDTLCAREVVPDIVSNAAWKLFLRTFPVASHTTPVLALMAGREAKLPSNPDLTSSPLLTAQQHLVISLRLAFKYLDDLFPQQDSITSAAGPLPKNSNPKNWLRLAEAAILASVDWDLCSVFANGES